jgi:hypothetical protein
LGAGTLARAIEKFGNGSAMTFGYGGVVGVKRRVRSKVNGYSKQSAVSARKRSGRD